MQVFLSRQFLIFTISSFLFFLTSFDANTLGYIESIKGNAIILNDNEQLEVQELDEFNLNHIFQLSDNAEVTLLLDDGSTIIVKGKSKFVFLEYEDIFSVNPHYSIQVFEGEITVETGELPKLKKNSTSIISPIGTLFLNGTAISAKLNGNLSEIFLLTDSFGDSGELILQNDNGENLNIEINSGLTVNEEGAKRIELNEEVINNQNSIKKAIANSAISNEKKIDDIIKRKIETGKISAQEAKSFKENIIKKKEKKIDQIISSSKSDTSILGDVLKNADGASGAKILEKVIDKNPKVTSRVLDSVIDENENLFKEISTSNSGLTEKILKTVVKEADENDQALSKIIAKTDSSISAKLITEIAETKQELMVKVVSETTALNPNKIQDLASVDQDIGSKITEVIVDRISNSIDATEDLKEIMLNADSSLTGNILEQTALIDKNLVDQAAAQVLIEEEETIIEKLSNSLDQDGDNAFNSILISKAIETGNSDLVSKAVEMNIQNKINNSVIIDQNMQNEVLSSTSVNNDVISNNQQNPSPNENLPTEDINNSNKNIDNSELAKESVLKVNNLINQEVEKLKLNNPEIEVEDSILVNVNEILASPN